MEIIQFIKLNKKVYLPEDHELDIWKPIEFMGSKPLILTSTLENEMERNIQIYEQVVHKIDSIILQM